ncbi:MAG: hypothetical protein ACI4CT_02220 [Lachnospiraceae bacterium]
MMYPFLTLDDGTEIVHSEIREDNSVKVYLERPDEKDGFHHATFILPGYELQDVLGFSATEISKYTEIIKSTSHLIMEFAKEGGFEHASGF